MSVRVGLFAAALALATVPGLAFGDPWKDESGHGRGRGEWKEEYRQGNCKIERKWEGNGEYKEEIECDGAPGVFGYPSPPVVLYPQPVAPSVSLPPLPSGPVYGEVYRDDQGRFCREYQTTGTIDGRRERLYGTVCLQPDGSWAFDN